MKKTILTVALTLFGLITLFVSSSVLFDWFGIRQKEGNFVPAVVCANWLCGFLYLMSAYYIFKGNLAAKKTLSVALGFILLGYVYLFIHIKSGGLYEIKTFMVLAFRLILTEIFLLTTIKILRK